MTTQPCNKPTDCLTCREKYYCGQSAIKRKPIEHIIFTKQEKQNK